MTSLILTPTMFPPVARCDPVNGCSWISVVPNDGRERFDLALDKRSGKASASGEPEKG